MQASDMFILLRRKAKNKNTLVLENAGGKKNLHQGGFKFTFLTSLVEFSSIKFMLLKELLKNYPNSTFLC